MVDNTNIAADSKGHGLICPACRVDLVMSERQGIEIDYCPKCRGVWLDRGELDKIIERSAIEEARAAQGQPYGSQPASQGYGSQPAPQQGQAYPQDSYDNYGSGHGGHGGGHGRGRRHGGFLGRLFD